MGSVSVQEGEKSSRQSGSRDRFARIGVCRLPYLSDLGEIEGIVLLSDKLSAAGTVGPSF